VECSFVTGFLVDYVYGGSWGEIVGGYEEDYCYVYFKTVRSYDYNCIAACSGTGDTLDDGNILSSLPPLCRFEKKKFYFNF
jgi:hypothetical protein